MDVEAMGSRHAVVYPRMENRTSHAIMVMSLRGRDDHIYHGNFGS